MALTLPVVEPSLDLSALAPSAPPLDPARWLAALGSVVAGALVGGSIGGWLGRRNRAVGAITAVAVAWHVGLFVMPVLPAAAGLELHAGSYCLDFCHIAIEGGATGTLEAFLPLGWFFAPIAGWGSLATLVIGVVIWDRALRPVSRRSPTSPADGWRPATD